MKKRTQMVLGLGLIAPLVLVGSAAAVTDTTTNQTTTTTTSTSDTTEKELEARIEKRKTELKTTLTQIEQVKIKAKCTAAQAVVKGFLQKSETARTAQTKAYEGLNNRLTGLITKLKAQNIDTTKLEAEQKELAAKIATYKTDVTNLQQSLSDTAALGCTNDPTGFKASLEAARTAREKVVKDATDIRTYVLQTIKPTLKDVKSQLEKSESSTTSNSTSATTSGGNQ